MAGSWPGDMGGELRLEGGTSQLEGCIVVMGVKYRGAVSFGSFPPPGLIHSMLVDSNYLWHQALYALYIIVHYKMHFCRVVTSNYTVHYWSPPLHGATSTVHSITVRSSTVHSSTVHSS